MGELVMIKKSLTRLCLAVVITLTGMIAAGCSPSSQVTSTSPETPSSITAQSPANTPIPTGTTPQTQVLAETFTPAITSKPSATVPVITQMPATSTASSEPVVFAVIGDYGTGDKHEAEVAQLVLSWQPDFIITTGDNNYPSGEADHIDAAVGQFFYSYIYPYYGKFGVGGEINRFFPTLGNHDTYTEDGKPYFDYFTLPGNERYYDFTWGPVHLFALDDIETEPDGVGASSKQAEWLKQGLASSTSAWNIVYMHYPPYSSGMHGSTDWARWPYAEWGADAVLAGHDHTYERLEEGGLVYFVNGLGGGGRYDFEETVDGSLVRYNSDYGAMRVEATRTSLVFEFITVSGEVVDRYELTR
jgi:tartrate-resistant acid phosphatase type 5